jgi:DNA-binding NarL/FixJ family response regulator
MRILLADDSVLILERLSEMLSLHKKIEIIGLCKTGTETLTALRNLKPDLAIVDLKMPGLTGLQVLTEIRKEDKVLKFILLTLHTSDFYRNIANEAGANYFFSKLDDFEKVEVVVNEMLNIN